VVDVTATMLERGHEQVVLVADRTAGLRAVLAIHSTALGPSLGGIRFWRYATEADAVRDALALSEAMTWKASLAGLHQGGGKAVVLVEDPDAPHPVAMLHALGRAIDELGGRYLAAEDVGASTADMDELATVTPWVTGVQPAAGGSGDPSPVTAVGVLAACRAVARALDGPDATLAGRRLAIQGAGKVGARLARLATDAGMAVTIADRLDARARAVATATGADAASAADVLSLPCDILAPCALGGVLHERSVDGLACRAVCGAANNQLAGPGVDDLLARRGILYVPDFLAGAGGIINIAEEFTGYSSIRAMERAAAIEDTAAGVLTEAARTGATPERVARTRAQTRVRVEGARHRWRPGDPTAWTHGEPLRRLRPLRRAG
jgi:glutamate dehydrogenase/leucine dehydrogenase